MNALRRTVNGIDSLVDVTGRIASSLVFVLMGLLFVEMIMRYVFDSPTSFAHELSAMLFSVMFLFGGAYALRWGAHVNVDVLSRKLSLRWQAGLDVLTSAALFLFVGVLFFKSVPFAIDSVRSMERSSSSIALYIWPVKVCLSAAAGLMLLAGISRAIKNAVMFLSGRPLLPDEVERSLFTV